MSRKEFIIRAECPTRVAIRGVTTPTWVSPELSETLRAWLVPPGTTPPLYSRPPALKVSLTNAWTVRRDDATASSDTTFSSV